MRTQVSEPDDRIPAEPYEPAERPAYLPPSTRLERLTRRMLIDFDRAAAAYHEAGHAVLGFWYGWVIGPGGVDIDKRQRCCFTCSAYAYTTEARAVVAMAGWLAERKWHRQGGINWDDNLLRVLDAHDWGQVYVNGNDERQVVKALVGDRVGSSVESEEFLVAVEAFREHASALIAMPAVWRAIRSVSRSLFASGTLSDLDVVNAIGDADFPHVSHGRWTVELPLLESARSEA